MHLIEVVTKPVSVGPHAISVGILEQLFREIAPCRDLSFGDVPVVQELPAKDRRRLLELKELYTGRLFTGIKKADRPQYLPSRASDGYPSVDVENRDRV